MTPAEQLVLDTLAAQRAKGRAKYGRGLDAHDGHDWPMEALQESLDLSNYLAAEVVRLRAALCAARRCPDHGKALPCVACDLDAAVREMEAEPGVEWERAGTDAIGRFRNGCTAYVHADGRWIVWRRPKDRGSDEQPSGCGADIESAKRECERAAGLRS